MDAVKGHGDELAKNRIKMKCGNFITHPLYVDGKFDRDGVHVAAKMLPGLSLESQQLSRFPAFGVGTTVSPRWQPQNRVK